jgi:hypothetical protein
MGEHIVTEFTMSSLRLAEPFLVMEATGLGYVVSKHVDGLETILRHRGVGRLLHELDTTVPGSRAPAYGR